MFIFKTFTHPAIQPQAFPENPPESRIAVAAHDRDMNEALSLPLGVINQEYRERMWGLSLALGTSPKVRDLVKAPRPFLCVSQQSSMEGQERASPQLHSWVGMLQLPAHRWEGGAQVSCDLVPSLHQVKAGQPGRPASGNTSPGPRTSTPWLGPPRCAFPASGINRVRPHVCPGAWSWQQTPGEVIRLLT